MNGYWLLLEDLDSATQDTFTVLSGLFENNYLSVPGFRDCVKVAPGFQLFVTTRYANHVLLKKLNLHLPLQDKPNFIDKLLTKGFVFLIRKISLHH